MLYIEVVAPAVVARIAGTEPGSYVESEDRLE
jgi:hypothetical protein